MQNLQDKIGLLCPEIRSAIYEAFAAAYTTLPTLKSLAYFRDLSSRLAAYVGGDGNSYAALATVAAEYYEASLNDSLDAVTQEYYDLFFVPSSARYVPPFESAIVSNVLWGRETVHCAECYKAVSFDPFRLDIFPPVREQGVPDHIGLQLAFAAFMAKTENACKNESEAASWRNLELQFLQEHLLHWVPEFASALQKRGHTFYGALTHAVADILVREAAELQQFKESGANCSEQHAIRNDY